MMRNAEITQQNNSSASSQVDAPTTIGGQDRFTTTGQWIGHSSTESGTDGGMVFMNVDRDRSHVAMVAFKSDRFGADKKWYEMRCRRNGDKLTGTIIVPPSADHSPWRQVDIMFDAQDDSLRLTGRWRIGDATGLFSLLNAGDGAKSHWDLNPVSWADFKQAISNHRDRELVYRGQSDSSWGLRTTFHRSGRSDLCRFAAEDVPRLMKHVTPVVGRVFKLSDDAESGALLNLAQHHGFPTPLLDWTESPYIAAFFAMSAVPKWSPNTGSVRVYAFNRGNWAMIAPSSETLMTAAEPYISIRELLPIDNVRAIPQQSLSMATNVMDIEGWIERNSPPHLRLLSVFDIPMSERGVAMADLQSMGITSASLFPGLQGTCEALRERYF